MNRINNNIKPALAGLLTVAWVAYSFVMSLLHPEMAREIFTAFTPVVMLAIGYYFGKNTGETKRDEAIQKLAEKQ